MPAVRGKAVCRMHGGKSKGAPKGNKNANKHGRFSREAIELRRAVAELIRKVLSRFWRRAAGTTAGRSGGSASTVRANLSPGTPLTIRTCGKLWCKVVTNAGVKGWVSAEDISRK